MRAARAFAGSMKTRLQRRSVFRPVQAEIPTPGRDGLAPIVERHIRVQRRPEVTPSR